MIVRKTFAPLTAVALVAGLLSPANASDIQLSTGTGGNYQLHVMSWWEIPFRSVVRQQYDFSCGSAAIATLLTYHYDHAISERESFSAMWQVGDQEAIRRVGFSMLEMKNFLETVGYRVEGYRLSPAQLASFGRPSIVLLDQDGYKHFVVVKGTKANRIVVGDPMLGLKTYAIDEFASYWNGIALAIASAPTANAPTYNSARDWDPWSSPPMAQAAAPEPTSGLTTHLPPLYQLTPQILVNPATP